MTQLHRSYDAWRTSPPPERDWPAADFDLWIEIKIGDNWEEPRITFTADTSGGCEIESATIGSTTHSAERFAELIGAQEVERVRLEGERYWHGGGADEWERDHDADYGDYLYHLRRDEE